MPFFIVVGSCWKLMRYIALSILALFYVLGDVALMVLLIVLVATLRTALVASLVFAWILSGKRNEAAMRRLVLQAAGVPLPAKPANKKQSAKPVMQKPANKKLAGVSNQPVGQGKPSLPKKQPVIQTKPVESEPEISFRGTVQQMIDFTQRLSQVAPTVPPAPQQLL